MPSRRTPRSAIAAQLRTARARDARDRGRGLRALSARLDRRSGRIILELSNGFLFGFPVAHIPALASATPTQLSAVTVSPGGGALRWEAIDVDLSVPGLLLDSVGRSQRLSELARLAGQTTSKAKARAARANGAKGGRPRKERA